jgi:hypothetical protein
MAGLPGFSTFTKTERSEVRALDLDPVPRPAGPVVASSSVNAYAPPRTADVQPVAVVLEKKKPREGAEMGMVPAGDHRRHEDRHPEPGLAIRVLT